MYPDAKLTLRLGFGRVAGYEEDATFVPWKTTLFGLFDRSASFDGRPPYELADRWRKGQESLNLATPLNFAYTVDTVGGNSGSPIVNRDGQLVGINFDSNQQKLANRYVYIDEADGGRAIGVHSAAIIESLTKLYGAQNLVAELQSARPAAAGAAGAWRQWGGPNSNWIVSDAPRLADSWPASGPPALWSRPLGAGHSAILADEGRLFTMYRTGERAARNGPWETEEVVSLDAATGKTIWEYRYPSSIEDFSRGPAPTRRRSSSAIASSRSARTSSCTPSTSGRARSSGRTIW